MAQSYLDQLKNLAEDYKTLWQKWGMEVETISEAAHKVVWLIHSDGLFRPITFGWEKGRSKRYYGRLYVLCDSENYWVSSPPQSLKGRVYGKIAEEWVREIAPICFGRLSEYLVVETARACAVKDTGLYIGKKGKTLYSILANDELRFQFKLRKTCWTWCVDKCFFSPYRWERVMKVKRPRDESPIPILSNMIKSLFLANL